MTHYERLKNGNLIDMIDEFVLAINWARNVPEADWKKITSTDDGLRQFIQRVLEHDVIQ